MSTRAPQGLVLLVSSVVLVLGAFQWGRATAAGSREERRRTAVVDAVAHAAPAVVSVEGTRGRIHSAGSGVIVHPRGFVVTNSHVIRGCTRVVVKPFQDGQRYEARVVADDPPGDLALLHLAGNRTWPYVSLTKSADVLLGETAIAIGNPRGLGDSITVGVVSAKERVARAEGGATIRNLIQTDASINSGNSGGPLLNLDGELIGINASMLPSASGIAFAIPSDHVEALLRRVLGGCAPPNPLPECDPLPPPVSPDRPVAVVRPTPPPAIRTPEPENEPLRPTDVGLLVEDDGRRLLVKQVRPGSPAALGGLLAGDVLLDVDGFAVESLGEVQLAFAASRPGRVYGIRVRRGGLTRALEVEIPR